MVEMPAYKTEVYVGWLLVGIGVCVSSCDAAIVRVTLGLACSPTLMPERINRSTDLETKKSVPTRAVPAFVLDSSLAILPCISALKMLRKPECQESYQIDIRYSRIKLATDGFLLHPSSGSSSLYPLTTKNKGLNLPISSLTGFDNISRMLIFLLYAYIWNLEQVSQVAVPLVVRTW